MLETDIHGAGLPGTAPEGAPSQKLVLTAQVVWLCTIAKDYKSIPISYIRDWIFPPVIIGQVRIYFTEGQPIGAILWANVSEEVAEVLSIKSRELQPDEWQSGTKRVVTDVISPYLNRELFLEKFLSGN